MLRAHPRNKIGHAAFRVTRDKRARGYNPFQFFGRESVNQSVVKPDPADGEFIQQTKLAGLMGGIPGRASASHKTILRPYSSLESSG